MSNYTKTTNFATKDSLPSGDANKIVKGAEINTEFDNIATAVATKSNTASPTFTGTVTIPTLTLGATTITATGAELNILDGVTSTTAELNILDGVTSTASELNILDGVTSTAAELNILDGVTATATELNIMDGVTATTAELNYVDGVTSNIQTQLNAKVASLSDLSITASASELNTMDGITATTAELNILDGVTSTASELNILDGVTSTTAELNILDGVTATTAELNYVDGVTSNVQTQLDAKSPIASPTFTGTVTIPTADINAGSIDGTAIGASSASTGAFTTLTATGLTVDTNTLYVDSTNNRVGIGTTSPDQALTVSGNIQIQDDDGYLQFKDTNGGTDNKFRRIYNSAQTLYISRRNDDESLEANDVVIDSSGRVGIGTTSADEALEVSGDVKSSGGNFGIYHFGETSDVTKIVGRDGGHGSFPNTMDFFTNSAQRMRIDASGNVGIGTTSPSAVLHTKSSGETARFETTASTGTNYLTFYKPSSQRKGYIGYGGSSEDHFYINNDENADIIFRPNNSEMIRLDASSGNVGIGTTSPAAKLQVTSLANLSEASPHFRIQGAGYQGYHWLDGTAYYIGQNSGVRALRLYSGAETAGVNLASGGTSWGTFSDERLKYDVEPVENAVESLSNLRTVKYRLKDVDSAEDKKKIGLMAQDLVGVLDEVIDPLKRTGDDTEYMSVRYTELVPVLVKAIQEQQTLIESLTDRIAALEE